MVVWVSNFHQVTFALVVGLCLQKGFTNPKATISKRGGFGYRMSIAQHGLNFVADCRKAP